MCLSAIIQFFQKRKNKKLQNAEPAATTPPEEPVAEEPVREEQSSTPETEVETEELAQETEEEPEELEPEVEDEAETVEPVSEVEDEVETEEPIPEVEDEEETQEPEPEIEHEEEPQEPEEEEDVEQAITAVTDEEGKQRLIIIKYKKSFTAKLIQSSDKVKAYYSELKNELLSYKGVKSRISWKYETFNAGRVKLAKMSIRGKSLSLFLALDPKQYAESKYIIDDKSDVNAYEQTPLLYRIKNDRRLKYSKELIETVMAERARLEGVQPVDYAKQYPYEEIPPLLKRGLIKELTDKDAQSGNVFRLKETVHVNEVNRLIQDEVAVAMIEDSEEYSDRTKVEIINIDVLSHYFTDGETVTLAEIQARVPDFSKKATAVKVLARGTLDKQLKVIADNFSIEAAKMILLTGGSVVKKKSK